MSRLHETHVCRECGAEITIPYAPPPEGDFTLERAEGGQVIITPHPPLPDPGDHYAYPDAALAEKIDAEFG